MTRKSLKVGLVAGALTLGMTWCSTHATRAQDNAGQQAGTQQDGNANQPARRGRGQGRGPGGGAARTPTDAVERMRTQVMALDLSDDQKTKLEAIFKESDVEARTLATEVASLQGRERAQKMMPFVQGMREKVNGVLTDEQKRTMRRHTATAMAKQQVERYRRATADLGLSDEQKTKVEALLVETEKKMIDAADARPVSGPGAPDGGAVGGGRGGPGGEIARDTLAKLNEILTPEQQTKLQETLRPARGQGGGAGRPPQN